MKVATIIAISLACSLTYLAARPAARVAAAFPVIEDPADLERLQGYLDSAPGGMDVRYAWTLPGGRGENVRVVDIEINWNLHHSDLNAAAENSFLRVEGYDPRPDISKNHGSAVIGELVAANNGVGITGIAHQAQLGIVSPLRQGDISRIADAIDRAAQALRPGDIILIEDQSVKGPHFNPTNGLGLLPVEFEAEIFDAIKRATDAGLIVIEPAGNGSENLDHADYNGYFHPNHDSGAIMVGAGFPPPSVFPEGTDRSRTDESNFGSRVDVQGWGRSIVTCGFGDLRNDQGENNFYTNKFGATSGAAAMVAGAAAVLQSIVKERGLTPLTSPQMRRLFRLTGTPQTGNLNKSIGPRPDLRAAIAWLDASDAPPRITSIRYKAGVGKLFVEGENFLPADSAIEINGIRVTKMKYPEEALLPNGTTTMVLGKAVFSDLLPRDTDVAITVFTPSTNARSEPFLFRVK